MGCVVRVPKNRRGDRSSLFVIGPTRCGKSAGIISSILSAETPAVIMSPKTDLILPTVRRRMMLGDVKVFDPSSLFLHPNPNGLSYPASMRAQPIEVRARGWYNPDLDYRDYMVPGILVQLVTVVGTLMTAMNIVREKELGTLDQLSVTPLSQTAFMAAKLIPFWIIALIELTLGLLVARFVFHIPMLGSIPLVFGAAAIYLFAALGIGLFVSTLVDTQQQAMFVTFFIIMVYLLMSGLFTPIRSMPTWAQWMAQLNPVKHFIEIMRAVLLKGATARDIFRPIAILALFGAVVLTLAVRQYGKRIG